MANLTGPGLQHYAHALEVLLPVFAAVVLGLYITHRLPPLFYWWRVNEDP